MSNVLTQGGLRLYKAVNGSGQNLEMCIALSGDSTTLGIGDPVKRSAAGATSTGQGPTVQAVTRAAAGDAIYGVMASTCPLIEGTGSINLGQRHRPASTAQYVYIRPSNNQDEYEICDDGSAAMTKANIGNNANLVIANCDTLSGMSKVMIDATTAASGNATRQVSIVGVVDDATNDPASINARWIVRINNSTNSGGTGTVGV